MKLRTKSPQGDALNGCAKFSLKVVNELKTRGVRDILIACCDGLKGFPEAIEAAFPQAVVQTCIVHMIRNSDFASDESTTSMSGLRATPRVPE